jgi:hypothetical protein
MVKVNIIGNALAYKFSYRRGINLIPKEHADILISKGVAEKIYEPKTAVAEPEYRTAEMPAPKPRKKPKKKK